MKGKKKTYEPPEFTMNDFYYIYRGFLFHIVMRLKNCKYIYDVLKSYSVFEDKDDELYDFDNLENYYVDKMMLDFYKIICRRFPRMYNNHKYIDNIRSRICPKLQKKENNENIRSLIHSMITDLDFIERELEKYTAEYFYCSRLTEITNSPDFQLFKKSRPVVSTNKTIFKKIRRDINNRFINTSSKNYVECFDIGIRNIYVLNGVKYDSDGDEYNFDDGNVGIVGNFID